MNIGQPARLTHEVFRYAGFTMSDQQQLHQAASLLQSGDSDEALKLLLSLSQRDPNNANVWQLMALAYKQLGDFERAEQAFQKALVLDPQPSTLTNLGNLYRKMARPAEAISCYDQALLSAPDNIPAQVNRGWALLDADDHRGAERAFADVLTQQPERVTALTGLAQALQGQGRQDEALDVFQVILNGDPNNAAALNGMGLSLKVLGYADEAVDFLSKAARAAPASSEVHVNLASALVQADRQEEAVAYYQRALELDPYNPDLHHWFNGYLGVIGHPDYLHSYREALRQRPDAVPLATSLARKLLLNGQGQHALDLLEQSLSCVHEARARAHVHRELSHVLRESEQFDAALEHARLAQQAAEDDRAVLEELSTALMAAGYYEPALVQLRSLLQESPQDQSWLALYCTALRYADERQEYSALVDYDRLVQTRFVEAPSEFNSRAEFVEYLRNALLALHTTRQHPVEQSMVHGTQTLDDLLSRRDDAVVALRHALYQQLSHLVQNLPSDPNHPLLARKGADIAFSDSWSVLLRQQGYHKNHFHSEGWLSSAFYLLVPDAVNRGREGWIKFGEPGFKAREPLNAEYWVKPAEGALVVFPSYLWHGTEPLTSASQRMTVGYDVLPTT